MDILIAIESVISVLSSTYVQGSQAKNFGEAIDVLRECVRAIERTRQEAKEGGEDASDGKKRA